MNEILKKCIDCGKEIAVCQIEKIWDAAMVSVHKDRCCNCTDLAATHRQNGI